MKDKINKFIKIFIFSLILVLTLPIIGNKVLAEENIYYSEYLNVGEGTYDHFFKIKLLNTENVTPYEKPINENEAPSKRRFIKDVLFEVNGEVFLHSYEIKSNGTYNINVYEKTLYKNVYKKGKLYEKLTLIVDTNSGVVFHNDDNKFYYTKNGNANTFLESVENRIVSSKDSLTEIQKKEITDFYNNFDNGVGHEEKLKIKINEIDSEIELISTIGFPGKIDLSFDFPMVIDINLLTSEDSGKRLSELYSPEELLYGLNVKTSGNHQEITKIELYDDIFVEIERNTKKEIRFKVYNSFDDVARTVSRDVYFFDSLNKDKEPPIIEFKDEVLRFDYIEDITIEKLCEGVTFYETSNISTYTNEQVKSHFNIAMSDDSFYTISWDTIVFGKNEINYTIKDIYGNEKTYTRIIEVLDVDPPKVLFQYNKILVEKDEFEDYKIEKNKDYIIIDNYDKNFRYSNPTYDKVTDNLKICTINVRDSSGNEALYTIEIESYEKTNWFITLCRNYKNFWRELL